jgi:hypothetical protein
MKRLEDHALAKNEMTKTQVTACIAALKKVLPDLSSVELSGDPHSPVAISVTDGKL